MALYVQPISNGSGTPTAMAAIAVDMARLAELMLPSAAAEGETVCLMDSAGGCLYPAGDIGDALKLLSIQMADGESASIDLDGQDTVVMLTRSVYTNWSLLWALPSQSIASASERLQLFVSLSSAAIILFAISITIMAAYFNNKPIREISRMLFATKKTAGAGGGRKAAHSPDPDDVSYGVKQLISLNQSIQHNLDEYRERLGEAMLGQLLEGKIQKEEEIRQCSLLLNGLFSHRSCAVLILRIGANRPYATGEDIEGIYMQQMVVLHQLIRQNNEIIHAVNTDEIAVIYLSDAAPEEEQTIAEQLQNRAGEILTYLQKMGHFNIKIGIGGVCGHPTEIYRSVQQAQTALFMARQDEQIILYDRKSHESVDAYYYPLEEERRLINMVRTGNPSETQCILKGLYIENYEKRKLNSAILDQLYQEIQGTLTKLTSSIPPSVSGEPEGCRALMPDPYPNPAYNKLCEEIVGLCNRYAEVRHTCTETMVQRIVEYLETVYMNENVSLNTVAEKYNLSEAYLSRIFKEQTGENFTACLERIRLHHAQLLLTQTRIPIHEIVHRVGYAYDDTFRKAFKRIHGISPGEYRLLADTQPETG